jgi:DNA-binding transcriptional ArsR family regulator
VKAWNGKTHRAMAHPVKRKIIESLRDNNLSFSELLQSIGKIDKGKFGYHLRSLKSFIKVDPTTKKYFLTRKGKFLDACIRDFRFITSVSRESAKYAEGLKRGDHAVGLCSTEEFKHEIAFPFLKAGLLKGEAVIYVASEHKQSSIAQEILNYGVNGDYLDNGTFRVMSAYDWYLEKGKAQGKTIIANWNKLIKEKRRAGFAGVRVVGETDTFFEYGKVEELLDYEEILGRRFEMDFSAICLYSSDTLSYEQFSRISSAHSHILSDFMVGEMLE